MWQPHAFCLARQFEHQSLFGFQLSLLNVAFESETGLISVARLDAGPRRSSMADIDLAELAKDPIYVGLVLGLLGIVVYFALGRKSFGPVPSKPYQNEDIP